MRHRHALYLSTTMTHKLNVAAQTHRVSKSAILERALQQYLAEPNGNQADDPQNLQHESMIRSMRRLERDLAISTELTSTFVRYFLMITPPISSSEHAAARTLGQLRFDQVIEEVAKRLRTDHSLMARVMSKLADEPPQSTSDNPGPDEADATPPSQSMPRDAKPAGGNG